MHDDALAESVIVEAAFVEVFPDWNDGQVAFFRIVVFVRVFAAFVVVVDAGKLLGGDGTPGRKPRKKHTHFRLAQRIEGRNGEPLREGLRLLWRDIRQDLGDREGHAIPSCYCTNDTSEAPCVQEPKGTLGGVPRSPELTDGIGHEPERRRDWKEQKPRFGIVRAVLLGVPQLGHERCDRGRRDTSEAVGGVLRSFVHAGDSARQRRRSPDANCVPDVEVGLPKVDFRAIPESKTFVSRQPQEIGNREWNVRRHERLEVRTMGLEASTFVRRKLLVRLGIDEPTPS